MRTYIISTSAFGIAIPNYFKYLAEYLSKKGNKVILVFDKHYKPEHKHTSIVFRTWPNKRPTKLKDAKFLISLIKEHKPDALIGQFGSTNINLIVGKLYRIPNRIIYWHTMFEQLRIDSTKNNLKVSLRHWIKRNLVQQCCTLVLTNSEATKEDLVKEYKINTKVLVFNYLIPDPIGNNEIKRNRDMALCFVARLDKSKGHSNIIDEMPQLLKVFPDLKLYIVGDGKERGNLEKQCRKLGIAENVIFTGPVSLEEVYEYMGKSLIHISASKEEAFGLVNAEALATGTPIMANRVGGIKDILLENKNGLFLRLHEKGSSISQVRKIMRDWDYFSRNARQSFLDRYVASEENVAKQVAILEKELK